MESLALEKAGCLRELLFNWFRESARNRESALARLSFLASSAESGAAASFFGLAPPASGLTPRLGLCAKSSVQHRRQRSVRKTPYIYLCLRNFS